MPEHAAHVTALNAPARHRVELDRRTLSFAAARSLGFGLVEGVPPHVYVRRVRAANVAAWKNLRICEPGEPPDVILRQAPAPQSIFRAMVRPNGLASCDILQVWLDVAAHPARGAEQAEVIRARVLVPVIDREA